MMGFFGSVLGFMVVMNTAMPGNAKPVDLGTAVSVRWDDDGSISRVPVGALTFHPAPMTGGA